MTTGPTPPHDAEEQLRQQSRFTATLLETLETAIVACDEHGNLTLFNRASRELHGLAEVTLPPEEWSRYYNLYEADGRTPLATEDIPLFRALNGEHVEAIEMVIAPVDGVRHTLLAHGRPIFDLDGMLLGAVVAMHDITDRRQLEGDLRCISEIARLVALNADAREAVVQAGRELTGAAFSVLFEPDGHGMLRPTVIAGLDPAAAAPVPLTAECSGTARSFRTGQSLFVADAADDPSVLPEVVRRPGVASVLFQPTHLGDEIVGVLVVGWSTPIANLQGREAGLAQLLSRETAGAVDRARYHRGLDHAAHVDVLTGLPNRRAWNQKLTDVLSEAALTGQPLAVALLDLNCFKALNDRAGHPAGDRLLQACGGAWRETLRTTDFLARLGGDEFAVLLPNCNAQQADGVAEHLREATPYAPGAAVGIALWDGVEHSGGLLELADAALYVDKARLRGRRLGDPARLRAVAAALAAADSAPLDDLTAIIAALLDVPVVLVSLVDEQKQVFPGQCGLPAPWGTTRTTPLSHSFCQHVVTSSAPLVVEDARREPLVRGNLAIDDLNVIAYAGVPIIDRDGQTLGALCAIDGEPRQWKPEDLAALRGLAPIAALRLGPEGAAAATEPVAAG